ncbi:MAG: hypothetical protein CMF69_03215 [Magnetovibrio sp.]|nr:hypothetical protein [Magnetovibrio sp.]|tara:strand:- start:504 stop:1400 length:897 start_codon:yes stop_codon:yes gene_type:complete
MKLFIDNNKIYTSSSQKQAKCFTEYGMKFEIINMFPISKKINIALHIEQLLLIPCTHITNIWHLMHHLLITYKYNKKYNIKFVFLIFFPRFYERQGNIINSTYIELIFKGMGFDFEKYKEICDIFSKGDAINVKNLHIVNQTMNFHHEPIINDFKNNILKNFNIARDERKKITFILRRGTREITNLDFVKKELGNIHYIYMEDLTIEQQLKHIADTDILIGVHGAGLAWCIFMKKNSLLIELYPGDSNTNNYIRWCNIANIRYERISVNISSGDPLNFREVKVNLNKEMIRKIHKKFQ